MPIILSVKTTQIQIIKQIIDTLNSLLPDCNITFYPFYLSSDTDSDSPVAETSGQNEGGIVIKEINKTSSILVHAKLKSSEFDEYIYTSESKKITIGINLNNLLKCIKCMSHFDTMTWQLDSDDLNKLIMILESSERNEKKMFKINLMDLDYEKYKVTSVKFPYYINLSSQDFHKNCKDMNSATDKMNIMITKDKVTFSGTGELGNITFELGETNCGLTIVKDKDEQDDIVQGLFELKYLLIFAKCTSLSDNVYIYLRNNYPLIMKYEFNLGEIKLVLSPSKPSQIY